MQPLRLLGLLFAACLACATPAPAPVWNSSPGPAEFVARDILEGEPTSRTQSMLRLLPWTASSSVALSPADRCRELLQEILPHHYNYLVHECIGYSTTYSIQALRRFHQHYPMHSLAFHYAGRPLAKMQQFLRQLSEYRSAHSVDCLRWSAKTMYRHNQLLWSPVDVEPLVPICASVRNGQQARLVRDAAPLLADEENQPWIAPLLRSPLLLDVEVPVQRFAVHASIKQWGLGASLEVAQDLLQIRSAGALHCLERKPSRNKRYSIRQHVQSCVRNYF